ncbi:MAG TPA: alpha/beta hydrolase [Bryobacteraceae bacterium]|jgi:acetyl esterase/lipase|nr:alpha/beta hydrolase [Bryobacteraceae bacterium]
MKLITQTVLLTGLAAVTGVAQQVIPLPSGVSSKASTASYPERQYFSKAWKTEVVANVTKPSLTVYQPLPWTANGTAAVICPGGGFMALSINSEGIDVAEWLAARGVTAFVLKYRLAHTGEDATAEFQQMWKDKEKFREMLAGTVPLSIGDGLEAVAYVREHASDWKVSPEKVGIVGFSAGGTVAAAAALRYSPESRPAFAAPIYAAASILKDRPVPADAPPLFLAAAQDDQLGLAGDSVALYEKWTAAHKPAELHMYTKGGHGFGMRKQGLPSDEWIERFWDWMQMDGMGKK